eukprot:gene10551-7505_t
MSAPTPGATVPVAPTRTGTWKSIKVQSDAPVVGAPPSPSQLPSPSMAAMAPASAMSTTNNQMMRTYVPNTTPRGVAMNTGPRFTFQNTSMATLNNPHMLSTGGSSTGGSSSGHSSAAPSPLATTTGPRGGPPPPRGGVGHTATRVEFSQPKLNIVKDPRLLPTPTLLSEVDPVRDFSQPAHKYPARKVDSRSEAKVSTDMRAAMPMTSPRGIPSFVGTSFTHLPNHHVPVPQPRPPRATIPRMFPALTGEEYAQAGMLLHNRTASGRILGNTAQRIISDAHVPYLPPEEPVGPDNPYVAINDTWTKCWDKEAGAVYYYNQLTGEATWIAPEL